MSDSHLYADLLKFRDTALYKHLRAELTDLRKRQYESLLNYAMVSDDPIVARIANAITVDSVLLSRLAEIEQTFDGVTKPATSPDYSLNAEYETPDVSGQGDWKF